LEIKQQLFAAAILHDFDKKEEITYTGSKGRTPESFFEAYDIAKKKLEKAGVDPDLIELAESDGYAALPQMEEILQKTEISNNDIAQLVLHYIGDYTLGSEWVGPFDGKINDLDRRMDANDNNPKYKIMADKGFYKEQRRVGYLVENKIAELIQARTGQKIEPKRLPEIIDQLIKDTIMQNG